MSTKREEKLESASLPVVTAFAFHIQAAYNSLLEILQEIETAKILRAGLEDQEADEELDEELAKREVIMNELLRITLNLDYGDEIGRRKVFSVVSEYLLIISCWLYDSHWYDLGDMLAHPELPPGLIDRCLDVLKAIVPSERDLIRVIVEIVVELREGEEDAQDVDDALVSLLHCLLTPVLDIDFTLKPTLSSLKTTNRTPMCLKLPRRKTGRHGGRIARILPLRKGPRQT